MSTPRQEDTPHIPLVVVRIPVSTTAVDEFVVDYRRYFGEEYLFLPTDAIHPPGRRIRFSFELADGREVVCGEGVVVRTRRITGRPERPPGMEVRYGALDEESQRVIDRMLALRREDALRRAIEPPPYESLSVQPVSEPSPVPLAPPAPPRPVAAEPAPAPRASPVPAGVLPANPFADVPTRTLELYVEWALEVCRAPAHPLPPVVTFGAVTARAPRREHGVARPFALGVAASVCAFLVGGGLAVVTRAPAPRPRAAVGSAAPLPGPSAAVALPVAPPIERPPPADPVVLKLRTQPRDARVLVDGQPRGRTPLDLLVAPGPHTLVLERPRYAPATLTAVAPGRVDVTLDRPVATLVVRSTPAGATVRVDGLPAGRTPLAHVTTAYERHPVEVELDGRVRRRRVYVRPPETTLDLDYRANVNANADANANDPRSR